MLKHVLAFTVMCLFGLISGQTAQAQSPGIGDYWAYNYSMVRPWHGQYYYLPYGQPTALVVPPNSTMQQNYSWGVSQNTMTPIYHQFRRPAPLTPGYGLFYATPRWPSHTDQFGVYPVRAPW
jgi:hypothetical protein